MSESDTELIKRAMERWIELVERRDIEGLQGYLDEFYDGNAWIDFGSRTPDALPGEGVGVIIDWARDAFAEWEPGMEFRYELIDVIGTPAGVVAPAKSVARMHGHVFETHFTYLFKLREGKIVSMTMYSTPEEALREAGRED